MARGGAHGRATFAREQQGSKLRLALTGPWVTAEVAGVDRALHELETGGAKDVLFDLSGIEILDTTGAWLLIRSQRALEEAAAPSPGRPPRAASAVCGGSVVRLPVAGNR